MASARPTVFAFLAISLSACGLNYKADFDSSSTVFASRVDPYCSVTVTWHHPQFSNYIVNIRRIIGYVTRARSYSSTIKVTNVDFESANAISLSEIGNCSSVGVRLAKVATQAKGGHLVEITAPFTPTVVIPTTRSDGKPSLSYTLSKLNPGTSIEDCSLSLRLSPSTSAEDDHDFQRRMSIARDVFGVPILFSALENDDFYITFYRQCESRLKMVGALEALVGPESKVAIISKSFVSRDELYRVYGPIL